MKRATIQLVQQRRDICRACPHVVAGKTPGKISRCSLVPDRRIAEFTNDADSACPLEVSKWGRVEPTPIPPDRIYKPPAPDCVACPGKELKALLKQLGIKATENCPCNAHAAQMDAWGPDECERRIDEIAAKLVEQRKELAITAWPGIVAKALTSGLAFKISKTEPIRSLVREAIARARANAAVTV